MFSKFFGRVVLGQRPRTILFEGVIPRTPSRRQTQAGFTLLEAVVAIGIFVIAVVGVLALSDVSTQTSSRSKNTVQANNYLQEGMDAVRALRDASWNNIATDGQYHLVAQVGQSPPWSLASGGTETIGIFSRTVTISPVQRTDTNGSGQLDAGDQIAVSGGTLSDPNTKKITVQVSWQAGNKTINAPLSTYLTNWAT